MNMNLKHSIMPNATNLFIAESNRYPAKYLKNQYFTLTYITLIKNLNGIYFNEHAAC